MSKTTIGQILGIVLTAAVALLAVFGYDVTVIQPRQMAPQDELLQFGPAARGLYATLCYRPEGGASFECDSGGTFSVNDGAALTIDSGGSLTASAGATVALGNLVLTKSDFTPTAGQTLTPAYGMYAVNSSGAVSMTLAAPSEAGQLLVLYGDDANTVTVNDTNLRSTDGNAVTFGQYDVVAFISSATEWIHVAKSVNQ